VTTTTTRVLNASVSSNVLSQWEQLREKLTVVSNPSPSVLLFGLGEQ